MTRVCCKIKLLLFLTTLLSQSFSTTLHAQELAEPGEIVVTAVEHYWAGAQKARVTARIEATGKNAAGAQTLLEQTSSKVTQAAKRLGIEEVLQRGDGFYNAGDKSAPISTAAAVRAECYLGFLLEEKAKAGVLIDALLDAGAKEITEVEYLVPGESSAHEEALKQAALAAQKKARNIAHTLGVELGKVVSASSSEEPLGAALRKQLQLGVRIDRYNERDANVYLTVRFEASKK